MNVQRAEVVNTSILATPRQVIAFLSDVSRWTSWAPWIRSVSKVTDRRWRLGTDTGVMQVEFGESNTVGVLDHHVLLDTGLSVFNGMRVIPNGTGSELVMTIFQQPTATSEEFERDLHAVREDLERIRKVIEAEVS